MSKPDPISIFTYFHTHSEVYLQYLENNKNEKIPQDLQRPHLLILLVVDREFGSNQKQIADKLFITKQSVGVSIAYLIKKKYLIKTKDPVDSRAYLIQLSDKAWKLIETIKNLFKEQNEVLKNKIGNKNYKRLIQIIKDNSEN
ncbi:MAG: winged helix-turn-helix transcriptional regulator [Saprospiraceae bacterium]|nr:winged helix-turn-helix transcriptional regulator [Saprospiraceae bacterium]